MKIEKRDTSVYYLYMYVTVKVLTLVNIYPY